MEEWADLIKRVKINEGFSSHIYRCSSGKRTIGYGFNIDAGISEVEATGLLEAQLRQRLLLLEKTCRLKHVNKVRQFVLVEMSFHLGLTGCLSFRKMWACIEQGKYADAAMEMRDSRWYRQAKGRCEKLAAIMESGRLH